MLQQDKVKKTPMALSAFESQVSQQWQSEDLAALRH
jgi:hypothetical protein